LLTTSLQAISGMVCPCWYIFELPPLCHIRHGPCPNQGNCLVGLDVRLLIPHHPFPSCPSSSSCSTPVLPSSGVQSTVSTTLPCPIRNLRGQGVPARRPPMHRYSLASTLNMAITSGRKMSYHAFFLNCLWMASNASLMVTPFRFRAVTSRPSGKCRSIFLTGGSVRNFLRTSFSSSVAGDLLSRLMIELASALRWHHNDEMTRLPRKTWRRLVI